MQAFLVTVHRLLIAVSSLVEYKGSRVHGFLHSLQHAGSVAVTCAELVAP